jgi:hypothetical protein
MHPHQIHLKANVKININFHFILFTIFFPAKIQPQTLTASKKNYNDYELATASDRSSP